MPLQYHVTGRTAAELSESLERSIRAGDLAAGDVLPPIRQLATRLCLSAGTVASAYRLLSARGLTSSDRRHGTWVRELRREELSARAARATHVLNDNVTDCASGNPDQSLLPDLRPILSTLAYEPAAYGSPVIHEGLAAEARRRFNSDGVAAEFVTCTFGGLDAIGRVLSSNLAAGDRVGLEDPGWGAVVDLVEKLGYLPIPLPLDESGPTPEGVWRALAAGARAVVITTRAQNPTGAAVTPGRAEELRDVLGRYGGRLVIEDDHACGLTEVALSPVASTTGRYAFVRSVSKGYGPDLRFAAVAGDAATINRLEEGISASSGWVSHLIQQIVLAMWEDDGISRQLALATSTYRSRREALRAELANHGIQVTPSTGLNVWIPVGDEATAVNSLYQAGFAVAPGSRFRIASDPAIRVTTASLPTERAAQCAAAIAEACQASAAPRTRRGGSTV